MKTSARVLFVSVLILGLAIPAIGCSLPGIPWAQERVIDELAEQGVEAKSAKLQPMSESHQIMAQMILMSNGMSSDLDSYKDVELWDVTKADGTQVTAVRADGKTILPKE